VSFSIVWAPGTADFAPFSGASLPGAVACAIASRAAHEAMAAPAMPPASSLSMSRRPS
jgi:hypothetical protein